MCFGWLRCKFHKVMILHYDKVFYGTIEPTLQHWSMVELKCFPRCSNCTTCGTTGLVSHWCCFWLHHFGCRCVRCDTSNEVEQDSALLDHHGSSASEVFEVGLPTLELYHVPKCTHQEIKRCKTRGKDISKQWKTWSRDLSEKWQTKGQGKIWTILYLYCSIFGILIDCHWGKIHRALDNQDN